MKTAFNITHPPVSVKHRIEYLGLAPQTLIPTRRQVDVVVVHQSLQLTVHNFRHVLLPQPLPQKRLLKLIQNPARRLKIIKRILLNLRLKHPLRGAPLLHQQRQLPTLNLPQRTQSSTDVHPPNSPADPLARIPNTPRSTPVQILQTPRIRPHRNAQLTPSMNHAPLPPYPLPPSTVRIRHTLVTRAHQPQPISSHTSSKTPPSASPSPASTPTSPPAYPHCPPCHPQQTTDSTHAMPPTHQDHPTPQASRVSPKALHCPCNAHCNAFM